MDHHVARGVTRPYSRRAGGGANLGPGTARPLWNVGLCAGRLEGPQLMRISLGRRAWR